MTWPTKKLGDKEYFEILGSGIEKFEEEKEYLSTSSIEGNKIIAPEDKITYWNRPSRANMQPRLNSVWFARMINTIKVYSFTEANKDEIDKYILSTGFAGILCNPEKVNPRYLEKIFLSKWFNDLKDSLASDKAIQKSLNNDDIANLEIPLPPLPIQQKIVKILDTIQDAVEVQEKIIEKTKELKKSLMNLLFHYGLAGLPVKELMGSRVDELTSSEIEKLVLKLKKTEVGEIPEDWEVVRLENNIEKPQYGISISATDENTGIGLLRITDIQEEKVDWNSVSFCKCTKDEAEKYQLKDGDIVIARIGATTGKSYFVKNAPKSVLGSYLIRIRAKDSLDPVYLSYYFQTDIYWFQLNLAKGGKLKGGINIPLIENLLIPLPPLPEQQEIAEILQTIDQKIEIEKKKKELYEELFRTMLNKIMSQEIDVEKIEI
jgi:type I restriction enzyme S subunit